MKDFMKDDVLAILKFEAYKLGNREYKKKMHTEISRKVWLSDREWYSFKEIEFMLNANPDTQCMSDFAFIDEAEVEPAVRNVSETAASALPLIF